MNRATWAMPVVLLKGISPASTLRAVRGISLLLFIVAIVGIPPQVRAQVFRCTDTAGKVSYQQQPCQGRGTRVEVPTATDQQPPLQSPATQSVNTNGPKPAAPSVAPKADPLAAYQRAEFGLSAGMSIKEVTETWGLPTDMRTDRNYSFMHWCDMRVALLIDGVLRAWDAPFADSKRGAQLYKYGEPWLAASMRWGVDRKIEGYSGPLLGRGEIHRWTPLRWIVLDSHGHIVSWCDAAQHRSPTQPPAFNPPWDTGR